MPGPPAERTPAPLPAAVSLGQEASDAEAMSMVQLLASPPSINRKVVSVTGYLDPPPANCDHCGTQLCLHKEDAENRLLQNCIGLDLPDLTKVSPLTHRYVRLQGVVVVERNERFTHVTIQDIRSVAPVPNREQWIAGRGVQ